MGTDKGLIEFQGKPQRQHLFDLLQTCCDDVFTSCRKEQQIPKELHPLVDKYNLSGPINGILSAFTLFPEKSWLVVAIDLPNVSTTALRTLLLHRDPKKLATCFFDPKENAPEPLLTLWEPAAFPLLLENANGGNVSPRSFLANANVQFIHSTETDLFLNINYPHQRDEWIRKG